MDGARRARALQAATDGVERDACARAVEKAVAQRAREVAQYVDPAVTAPVAVAAVPDAAYEVLRRAHADAYVRGVVIVPYSAALPIVLFLYALVQRFGDAADVQASLAEMGSVLDALELVVENRFARAGTMITNGADEFRSQLGKAGVDRAGTIGVGRPARAGRARRSPGRARGRRRLALDGAVTIVRSSATWTSGRRLRRWGSRRASTVRSRAALASARRIRTRS